MNNSVSPPNYYILEHHGIKGQKWGVRRFQNKDGTLTAEGRQRQLESRNVSRNKPYTDDVNDIVRTLSKKERDFLGAADNEDWIDKKYERDTLVNKAKTFVSKEGDTPVSFIEIWTDGGRTGQISLATRNDPKYRGKGYASKNVEQAIKWVDRYGNKSIDELEWIADRKNTASVNLGKKYGFVEDNPNKHGHNWKDDWSEEYAIMYRPVKYLAHHGIKGQKWGIGGVRIRMENYIYDDYLEHHGIKGQKWGVRRTPEQLGHAVSRGHQSIASFFGNAKKSHQARVSAKNKAQLAKYQAKEKAQQERINVLNQKLAVKQQKAEIKRLKKNLHGSEATNAASAYVYDKVKQHRERKRLDKLARQQAVRNAKSSLITSAIVNTANAGVKLAATSVVNSPDASEGARLFAKYMGGEERQKEKNSLKLLKTKSMNDMSDAEIRDVNTRLTTMNHIDTILDAQRKKRAPTGGSNQNGSNSYSITRM